MSHTGRQNPDLKIVLATGRFYSSQMSGKYFLHAKPALLLARALPKPPGNSSEETLNCIWKLSNYIFHFIPVFLLWIIDYSCRKHKWETVIYSPSQKYVLQCFIFPTNFRSYRTSLFIQPKVWQWLRVNSFMRPLCVSALSMLELVHEVVNSSQDLL